MSFTPSDYVATYGPRKGDRVRLGDTGLVVEVESDASKPGEEFVVGFGKTARDGLHILAATARQTCDLVISDYAMPNLSGTEFLRHVRELCPGIPALIITGYAEKESLVEGLDGVEVLLKPFTPSALEAAIGRISETEAAEA